MRHLKFKSDFTLEALQKAFAQNPPAGMRDFWLAKEGGYAQIETSEPGLIGLQATAEGIKLTQAKGAAETFEALVVWLSQITRNEALSYTHVAEADQDLETDLDDDPKADPETNDAEPSSAPAVGSRSQWAQLRSGEDFYANPAFLAEGWEAFLPTQQGLNFEIGCGYGHFLAWLAPRHPEQAFIGVDIVTKVLRRAQRRLRSASNVVLAKLDAMLSLQELVTPASLDHLYILFPDPWPKALHRRSLRPDTLPLFASRLKAGGRLLFVSDDADYAQDAEALLSQSPYFQVTDFPEIEVKTKYEKKWLAQSKQITRLAYVRKAMADLPDAGTWPGYAPRVHWQMPDWDPEQLNCLYHRFAPKVLKLGNLSLKLDACYRASHSSALRMRLILAPGGSTLAQHSWLELNPAGQLAPAANSWLPCLPQRETILAVVGEYLHTISQPALGENTIQAELPT